jgi:hypothetical protein
MTALAVPHIGLPAGPLTGDDVFGRLKAALDKLVVFAGYSNFAENEVLDSSMGDHATINLFTAPTHLALCTVAVAETDTGSTITEANYTGYARKSIAAADLGAASGGSKSNSVQQQFAGATAGSSVIIGWALCTASTTGNIIFFGTCTSTTVSSTQTPATVAVGALTATLD